MHGIATRRGAVPAAAPAAAPAPIPAPVLACRQGEVLDLRSLSARDARVMFRMSPEAWAALDAPGSPPITEVRLPQAVRPKHLAHAVRGIGRLAHLRLLALPAPGGSGKVSLQGLAHPSPQLLVALDLPESGGCTVDLSPRLSVRAIRTLPQLATGKHEFRTIRPGQPVQEPRRTLPNWPYLRDIGNGGVEALPRLRLPPPEARRRSLYRLLRQVLIAARATDAGPAAAAGLTHPVDPADAAMARGFQAMSADTPDLPSLLTGLEAAFARLGPRPAGSPPPPRVRFRYGYGLHADRLARLLGPTLDAALARLNQEPPCALLHPDALGPMLAHQLNGMAEGERRFLALCGSQGAVALILTRRQGMEASVVCHDPQLPTTHVRLVTHDLASLAQVRLKRLMTARSFSTSFGASGLRLIGAHDLRQLLPPASATRPPRSRMGLFGLHASVLARPEVLEIAMQLGPAFLVSDSLQEMDAQAVLTTRPAGSAIARLEAVSARMAGSQRGRPLLAQALREDRVHPVAAWLAGVLAADVFAGRPQARARLLRAHHFEPVPRARRLTDPVLRGASRLRPAGATESAGPAATALSMALCHSPLGTGLWVRHLLAADEAEVSSVLKRILLLEAEAEGGPLLHRLLAGTTGTAGAAQPVPLADALYAYAYEVAASTRLPEADKRELLRADRKGEPAMQAGLRRGHGAGVAAIACALLDAPLPSDARSRLLDALGLPLATMATALNLQEAQTRYWVSRMLPRLGRPGVDAGLAVRLRQAWAGVNQVDVEWSSTPRVRALLAAGGLKVAGTDHTAEDFSRAGLRALQAESSRLLMLCRADRPLADLMGWRLAPGMRPLTVEPGPDSVYYLLPVELLSPLAPGRGPRAPLRPIAVTARSAPSVAAAAGPASVAGAATSRATPPRPDTPSPESKTAR